MSQDTKKKAHGFEKLCLSIERVGHKIPDPLLIFGYLTLIVFVVSLFIEGHTLTVPGTENVIETHSLLSKEFFVTFISGIPTAFVSFTPVKYVLILLFGTAVCSETGLFEVSMKRMLRNVPDSLMVVIIIVFSINGNIVGDGLYAFLPALAGMMYASKGKNPLLGIVTSYGSIAGAFSACMLIANADVQLAGLTAEAAAVLNIDTSNITGAMNYYWQAIAAVFLIPVAWFTSEKIVRPILEREEYKLDDNIVIDGSTDSMTELTDLQRKGVRNAGISVLIYLAVILTMSIPQNGFLRNAEGKLIASGTPFMSCLIMMIMFLFFIPGITYGISAKVIKNDKDLSKILAKGISSMSPFLVMCLGASIFNTCFNYTNLASLIAIRGAEWMESVNLTGLPLILFIVILCSISNLFMPNTISKWVLLAPVMVPMCTLLGFSPAFTTALYKIGNSTTNCITPLSSGMIIALGEMQKYRKNTSLGSIISLNIPFAAMFTIFWLLMTIIFYVLQIPLGPEATIFM